MATEQLQCFNKTCGQMYREEENHDEACCYHPGQPVFHDGFKGWDCCERKTRDFSLFMEFKGCKKGRHSNIKPVNLPNKSEKIEIPINKIENEDMKIENSISVSELVPPQSDLLESISINESPSVATAQPPPDPITICRLCKKEKSTLDLNEICRYHRGNVIFHDTYKFWTCCRHRRFDSFEDCQKFEPCARADSHDLIAKIEIKENWFQTNDSLTIALYGLKGVRKIENKSLVKLKGGRTLSVSFVDRNELIVFEKTWNLYDYVIGEKSSVQINPSNVLITLIKSRPKIHWPSIEQSKDTNN
ncbi:Cysteine and histidine-rich domain-containing protein 1 [Sarcoptes scabiei]|uniref:Cysteine and histidine-rich domain-containing protein 1 n=1 Tax=Sarcoptes scabiei TaxID=52283 RepID=A0A834RE18_SARSC|nr:Cysteine and histidine-rich domain-containing protein 1 [Sarcoptes scabiei]